MLLKTLPATVFHHSGGYIPSLEQLEMYTSMQSCSSCDDMYNKEQQTSENEDVHHFSSSRFLFTKLKNNCLDVFA